MRSRRWARTEATRARSQRRFVCCYVHGCLSSHAEWTLRQQGNIVPVRSAGPLNPLPLACTAASRYHDPQGRWQRPTRPLRFASGSRWCFCAGRGTACVRQPQLAEASTRAQGQTRVCASRWRGRGVLCVLPLTFYGLIIPPSPSCHCVAARETYRGLGGLLAAHQQLQAPMLATINSCVATLHTTQTRQTSYISASPLLQEHRNAVGLGGSGRTVRRAGLPHQPKSSRT